MSNVGILMSIFGLAVLAIGYYMYTGHKIDLLTWRHYFKNLSIDEWKNIGKWTMLTSIGILVFALIAFIFKL